MKNILAIYYAQTGQLTQIVRKFLEPWQHQYHIDYIRLDAQPPYPFPWTWEKFFDVFPESVLTEPCRLKHTTIPQKNYHLVLLAFQPWFLHPSIPFATFMQTPAFTTSVTGKPVVLITHCRNTWRNSTQIVKKAIHDHNGTITSEFIFRDTRGNLHGALTMMRRLLSANKKQTPAPHSKDPLMKAAYKYGQIALEKHSNPGFPHQTYLVPPTPGEFTSPAYEAYVVRKFKSWAKYITARNNKHRRPRLLLFKCWLVAAIIFVAPVAAFRAKKKNTAS